MRTSFTVIIIIITIMLIHIPARVAVLVWSCVIFNSRIRIIFYNCDSHNWITFVDFRCYNEFHDDCVLGRHEMADIGMLVFILFAVWLAVCGFYLQRMQQIHSRHNQSLSMSL